MQASYPLLVNYQASSVFALRDGLAISQQQYLTDVLQLKSNLSGVAVINACSDRYLFAVGFAAAVLSRSISLLPPAKNYAAIAGIASEHQRINYLHDGNIPDGVKELANLDFIDLRDQRTDDEFSIDIDVSALMDINANQHVITAYTSGSTGLPKPNAKSWLTLVNTAQLLNKRLLMQSYQQADQQGNGQLRQENAQAVIATVPPQHMYGMEMSVMTALQGAGVLVAEQPFYPADIEACVHSVTENRVNKMPAILVTTPVHLRSIMRSGIDLDIQFVVCATAPLPIALAGEFEAAYNCPVFEIYGFTEVGSAATRQTTQGDLWQTLDGMRLQQVDTQVQLINDRLNGETHIVADRVLIQSDNSFDLLGRPDNALNRGGKRHSIAGLTEQLLSLEGVRDAYVFLPKPDVEDSRPAALVVSDLAKPLLYKRMQLLIESVFIPRPMVILQTLPRNETGKISRAVALECLQSK